MSLHHFLQVWPRATRFFVLALAMLQFLAPTWHICALGGHSGAHSAAHPKTAPHHGASINATLADNAPLRPLICFCAPHQKPLDAKTPRLDGVSHSNHATCLALLLQAMPGQIGAPPKVVESRALIAASFDKRFDRAPHRAAPRGFRGRAPPWKC